METILHALDSRLLVIMLALPISLLFGGPRWLHRLLLIDMFERSFRRIALSMAVKMNRSNRSDKTISARGRKVTLLLLISSFISGAIISVIIMNGGKWMFIPEVAILALTITIRPVLEDIANIQNALEGKQNKELLERHLKSITHQKIDISDKYSIHRAMIEQIAKRLASNVISPLFWYMIFGLAGALSSAAITYLFRLFSINSLQYEHFGKSAASWARFFHFIPARISVFIIFIAAFIAPKSNPFKVILNVRKFAQKDMPALKLYPVAAMSGALDLALLGPQKYITNISQNDWIGTGSARPSATHVKAARFIFIYCTIILIISAFFGYTIIH